MTISISRHHFFDIFFEDESTQEQYDPADEFDISWQYPSQFGKGYSRTIDLPAGLGILISHYQLHDDLVIQASERSSSDLLYGCCFMGTRKMRDVHSSNEQNGGVGQYLLMSGGALPSQGVGQYLLMSGGGFAQPNFSNLRKTTFFDC
ncbi:hypothetical protein [Myxacorys almedinensis]|uniref:Uncharacterized protein n=1 Tax=Myxacorys almedinensis A TaxID=2690445 RepID=A0A8J7ZDB9_9CYAN|nr:hypothetical protein [Myxacorys almedinensis]NDJ19980.1 hypothetical protein [Myxacorys almedinensis A]